MRPWNSCVSTVMWWARWPFWWQSKTRVSLACKVEHIFPDIHGCAVCNRRITKKKSTAFCRAFFYHGHIWYMGSGVQSTPWSCAPENSVLAQPTWQYKSCSFGWLSSRLPRWNLVSSEKAWKRSVQKPSLVILRRWRPTALSLSWHHYLTRHELANTHWRDNHESF